MSRLALPEVIARTRIIAVMRRLHPDRVMAVSEVLAEAGIEVFEVTMDGVGAADSITRLAGCGATVGAGTVLDIESAKESVGVGASFLVAPHFDPAVVEWSAAQGIPMVPGAFTPTEVVTAWNAGIAAVKIFPASVGGPDLLRALGGPLGDIPLIPTGGITAANAAAFLEAGAVAVGVGGWLTGHTDLAEIRDRAHALLKACTA